MAKPTVEDVVDAIEAFIDKKVYAHWAEKEPSVTVPQHAQAVKAVRSARTILTEVVRQLLTEAN